MAINQELLQLLQRAARSQTEIRLLNIYKGLPLLYETTIEAVGGLEISVPSSRQHLACLFHQRETYLQTEAVPFLIRSQVISLNLAKEAATLSHFEVAKPQIGKRSQIRVEPEEALAATIQFRDSGYEMPAALVDISSEGASMYLPAPLFPVRQFKVGNEINVSISFPDTLSQRIRKGAARGGSEAKVTLQANGKIASVLLEAQENRYRVGMRLFFHPLSRAVVLQYIAQRQAEIIRDLRLLSEELYKRHK